MPSSGELDWSDPAFLADPYPPLQRLREQDPVHRHPSGFWLVTRYADAVAMLRDERFVRQSQPAQKPADPAQLTPVGFLWNYGILWQDPPNHTRLRRLFNKAFTPAVVNRLRPHIAETVNTLLDQAGDQMELIDELAYPLPVMVIASMLGVPLADRELLRQWSHDLVGAFDPARGADSVARGSRAIDQFRSYFRLLIAERKAEPQDDLLSSLIAVHEAGERLSEDELLANVIFLFVAGHETTVGLIGNGLLALLRNDDQLLRWQAEPDLTPAAVEELLRYESPQQTIFWTVREAVTWDGRLIRPGETVLIMVGAVNRDPAQFDEPDRLDLGRTPNPHLAFSRGAHFCLGAPLARAQAQIALPAIINRFPQIRPAGDPVWRPTMFIRELQSLPVTLGA